MLHFFASGNFFRNHPVYDLQRNPTVYAVLSLERPVLITVVCKKDHRQVASLQVEKHAFKSQNVRGRIEAHSDV